jgi:succinate dehydrogenase / fumarate reductase cytochrome b subunit
MRSRPLSPHLQIYRPQITSVLSILHRITGVALSFSTIILVSALYALAQGPATWATFSSLFQNPAGTLVLLGMVFSLHFHALNGLRHLSWDLGYGYRLSVVTVSGILALSGSIILTALFYTFFF